MSANAKNLAILIAEDDDDDYLLTEKAFKDCRFEGRLYRVKDGEELMAFLHAGLAQNGSAGRAGLLLLLDLNMPRKDGREALLEIKAHPELRKIPIVVLSTSNSEADISSAYSLGANSFIRKTVGLEQFADLITVLNKYWFEVVELPHQALQKIP
jgi:CheY-like chemotaxis protein